MTVLETIQVGLPDRRYEIMIGRSMLAAAGAMIASETGAKKCAIVTDEIVAPHYLEPLKASCAAAALEVVPVVLPPNLRSNARMSSLH
jgi:3-dehydroquinate synthase